MPRENINRCSFSRSCIVGQAEGSGEFAAFFHRSFSFLLMYSAITQVHNFCVPNTRHWDDSLYLLHKPGCCEWNDSDPDFVFNTSQPILIDPLYLFSSIPRAVHAGECGGIHYRGELKAEVNCSMKAAIQVCC